jgi:hypothetical protein
LVHPILGKEVIVMLDGEYVNVELMDRAVAAQGEGFSADDIREWFARNAPEVDPLWIDGRISGDTVNDSGRRHIPEPRNLLYLRGDGLYERYDPERHGEWTAAGTRNGHLTLVEGEGSLEPWVVNAIRTRTRRRAG